MAAPSPASVPAGFTALQSPGEGGGKQCEAGSDNARSGAAGGLLQQPKWMGSGSYSSTALPVASQGASREALGSSSSNKSSNGSSKRGSEDGADIAVSVLPPEEAIECPQKPPIYMMFVLLGCTSLICWNFVIQTLPFILLQKLRRPELNNLFLGLYQVANLFMQLVLMRLSRPIPLLVVFASVGSGVLGLCLAAAVAVMPQADPDGSIQMSAHLTKEDAADQTPLNTIQITFLAVVLVINIFMGCCQGLIQGVGYTLASQIRPGYVAAVSLGQGSAGLLVFALSTLVCFLLFDVDTAGGLQGFCFFSFSIVAATAFLFAIFFFFRLKTAEIAANIARVAHSQKRGASASDKRLDYPLKARRSHAWGFQLWGGAARRQQQQQQQLEELEQQQQQQQTQLECATSTTAAAAAAAAAAAGDSSSKLWLRVLQRSWRELLLAFFHFSYTYHLYPSVGPLGWRYSWTFPNQIVVLYGVWFLCETIGRASPDLVWVKGFKWLRPSRKMYAPISLSTLLFIAPFLLGYIEQPITFFTNPIWYLFVMASFAFAHGWIGTLAFFYACNAVHTPEERNFAGPLTVLSVGFGCVVGFLTSLAY